MSRQVRQYSKTRLYHIVFRGINHCHLFEEKMDYEKYLTILQAVKKEMHFEIYAYCLMSNHVHMFIKEENTGDIVRIMRKILTHYVGWFNRKYGRSGALIANRYKSECVEDDEYLFSIVRYIHNNPRKAGIVDKLEEYEWSSYSDYLKNVSELIDIKFILEVLSEKNEIARKFFIELHEEFDGEVYIPLDKKKKSEEKIRREIISYLNGKEPNSIANLQKNKRNEILFDLRQKGFSIREIERATGISRGIIYKSGQNRTVPK